MEELGIKQKECQDLAYLYLKEALSNKFDIIDQGEYQVITFANDELSEIEVKLYHYEDYNINIENLKAEVIYDNNWTCREQKYIEGGLLYKLCDKQVFWNLVCCFHSFGTTFDIRSDLDMDYALKNNNIYCMFYETPFGCKIPDCQFVHSEERRLKNKKIIRSQRKNFLQLTPKEDKESYKLQLLNQFENENQRQPTIREIKEIEKEVEAIKCFCKGCHVPQTENVNFKLCSRCIHAYYCSKECQQKHWKTHKLECLNWEKLIVNDEEWYKFYDKLAIQ